MELVCAEELVLRNHGFEVIHSVRETEVVDLETLSFVMEGTGNVRAQDRLDPGPIDARDAAEGPPRIVVDQGCEVPGRNGLDRSESGSRVARPESRAVPMKRSREDPRRTPENVEDDERHLPCRGHERERGFRHAVPIGEREPSAN